MNIKKPLAVIVILLFISVSVAPSSGTCVDTDIDYNNPPTAPIFLGPTRGVVGEEYRYTINSTDSDGDDVYYVVIWEPGVLYEWFGPYPSGEEVNIVYTWDERGTYYVLSQAADVHNATSDFTILKVIIGEIIYVDDDNTEGPWNGTAEYPYQYIQDGIDNAFEYDTVFVYNGTYYENIIVNKSINLVGEDKNTTVIDGMKIDDTLWIKTSFVNVSGFTIFNSSYDGWHSGIYVIEKKSWPPDDPPRELSNINIFSCIIKNNDCGVRLINTYAVNISYCIINNNPGHSIYLTSSSQVNIDKCEMK